jgi:hypothetical protein
MEILNSQSILETAKTTTEKALELFDALEPVSLEFMIPFLSKCKVGNAHRLPIYSC